MNVKQLIELLSKYPDDLEVLTCMYSDYHPLEEYSIYLVNAVDQGGYVMRSHDTMSEDNKKREKQYLYFEGN